MVHFQTPRQYLAYLCLSQVKHAKRKRVLRYTSSFVCLAEMVQQRPTQTFRLIDGGDSDVSRRICIPMMEMRGKGYLNFSDYDVCILQDVAPPLTHAA